MRRLLPLVLLACGAPQPAAPAMPAPAASAAPGATPVASASLAPAPAVRRRVVAPDTRGCLVHAEGPFAPRTLRVAPDGAAYATVTATDDERVLFYRGGTVPYVELETADGGLRLRGYADVPPRATRPFALSGVIFPKKKARLRWSGTTDDGRVTVALSLSPRVTLDGGGHLATGDAPCAALTVLTDDTEEERNDEPLDNPVLLGKLTLAVRAEPGGAVRATVDVADDFVELGEVRGASRRIDVPFDDFDVRGWVPARLPVPQTAAASSYGSIGLGGRRGTKLRSAACAAPLTVYAKVGGDLVEVGTVGANFPVKLAEKLGEYARIDIGDDTEAGKLPWYARTADIEGCSARATGGGWRFE